MRHLRTLIIAMMLVLGVSHQAFACRGQSSEVITMINDSKHIVIGKIDNYRISLGLMDQLRKLRATVLQLIDPTIKFEPERDHRSQAQFDVATIKVLRGRLPPFFHARVYGGMDFRVPQNINDSVYIIGFGSDRMTQDTIHGQRTLTPVSCGGPAILHIDSGAAKELLSRLESADE